MNIRLSICTILVLLHTAVFAQNIEKVVDLNVGSSDPQNFIVCNGKLFFTAYDGKNGWKLWLTDGTANGTKMVKDVPYISNATWPLYAFNNRLFFIANDSAHGTELWVSDGTESGTYLLKDILSPFGTDKVYNFTELNNKLYFLVEGNGYTLWVTDGTTVGTEKIAGFLGSSYSYDVQMCKYNNNLFINGAVTKDSNNLWVNDGTSAGTKLLKDFRGNGTVVGNFYEHNGLLYFAVVEGTIYSNPICQPWVTDGTDSGTHKIKNLDSTSRFGLRFLPLNNRLYFISGDWFGGHTLWETDGTSNGTYSVVRMMEMKESIVYNGKLYFNGETFLNEDEELWVSDGTASGTYRLANLDPYIDASPRAFTEFNGKLYFVASGYIPGYGSRVGLWESDGTSSGTHYPDYLKGEPHYPMTNTRQLIEYDGALYFNAQFDGLGFELWRLSLEYPTNVEQANEKVSAFTVYPNPATNVIFVESANPQQIVIKNVVGQNQMVRHVDGNSQIDISELQPGMYFVNDEAGNKIKITKQ